VLFIKMGVGLV